MKIRAGAVLLWFVTSTGAGSAPLPQNAFYTPAEWQSITVTRFAERVVPGARFTALSTTGGLLLFDHLRDRWRFPVTTADGLPPGAIERIARAEDGTILVATRAGEVRVEPSTGYFRNDRFPERPPPPTLPLPANLFSGRDYQYLGDGRIVGPLTVTAPVTDIRSAGGADAWLATMGLGAGRADLRTLQLEMRPHGLWSSEVRALAVTDEGLVAGGLGDLRTTGGLTEWRFVADEWHYLLAEEEVGLLSDRVFDLVQKDGGLWLAVVGGVSRRDVGGRWRTWSVREGLPDRRVTALASGSGAVWVGTRRGVAVIAGDSLEVAPLPDGIVVSDVTGQDESVWLATDRGAWGYRGRWPEGTFVALQHPEGALSGRIDAVGSQADEVWWAGAGGIVAYDAAGGNWLDVPGPGPLMPGEATSISVDTLNVWVTTRRGVWRLIRETGRWCRYDEADGLIDSRVWCSALRGDTIWFGTRGGITRFDFSRRRKTP